MFVCGFRKGKQGFTLIELLGTLTVMAIIATVLMPFIGNYLADARYKTNLRSMTILQDAIDRARVVNPSISDDWGDPAWSGRYLLSTAEISNVLTDITTPGQSQTMRSMSPPLTGDHVVILLQSDGTDRNTASWEVVAYRRSSDVDGVDRAGRVLRTGSGDGSWTDEIAKWNLNPNLVPPSLE